MSSLIEIANRTMREKGFFSDFPPAVVKELVTIQAAAAAPHSIRDLRDLFWISIDNDDSLDLDQLTFAEDEKIYVAVADVDSLVKKGSAIDQYAAHNTTSVYTPTKIFPMLPPKLSTDLTSLNEQADRCAIVIEVKIQANGQFDLSAIYPAHVCNKAKLAYNKVASYLDNQIPFPPIPELKEQLQLQDQIAKRIESYRVQEGALYLTTIELEPVIAEGVLVDLKQSVLNRAHHLIENFMIAANVAATHFLMARHQPTLRRIVRTPKRWDRIVELVKSYGESLPQEPDSKALRAFLVKQQQKDPAHFPDLSLAIIKLIGRGEYTVGFPDEPAEGHFDLALRDYTHATAPNRRYPDLVMQRLLKGEVYSKEELSQIAIWCTQKETDATKVERRVEKSAAAMVLSSRIGEIFKAMVTGINENGTWVRILSPPVEGKLIHGFDGLDVGDYLTVKLLHVDIDKGHIDFKKSHFS